MRIGLFGGTFDPIHIGHLIIAETLKDAFPLDRILFIPAAVPPHKDATELTASRLRVEMVEAAISENPGFEMSDVEIQKGDVSYTIDTVRQLRAAFKDSRVELFLIVGGDSLVDLVNWKDPDRLLEEVPMLVAGRPGYDIDQAEARYRSRITVLDTPLVDVSSTEIRRRVREGKSIRYWVPGAVEFIIAREGLYR